MTSLRFALAQHDFRVGAVTDNAHRMGGLLAEAAAASAALVVFPQLALSGPVPQDLLRRRDFLDACAAGLATVAQATAGVAAMVGTPLRAEDGGLVNAAAWLENGALAGCASKRVLTDDERRHFRPGEAVHVTDVGGIRLACLVGEDIADPAVARQAAEAGAELIIASAAAPWWQGVQAIREAELSACARASGCAVAWVNAVGGQDDRLFDGVSMLVNADGTVVARAPAFSDALLACRFDAESRTLHAEGWPGVQARDEEALLHAGLVRGIRDYTRKNGFDDVVLGLSGGIDSALTLALAVDALGAGHVTAVMLPSRYTSDMSLDGARQQAEALGVAYEVLPIEPGLEAMLDTLRDAFDGRAVDTTEENLQARIRGMLLMALSNKHRRLLLCTGNKSEAAVGYATLYGDMCGGYAPLKDVYKTRVYRLARWRNGQAAEPVIPWKVIERPPSAELRDGQTDQDSLPPYDELDAILESFIEQERSEAEIVATGHDAATVQRVIRLVRGNEFKRRQGPPGPRVTARGFGSEWRYPITSGWR